jgi:hypothetical protein
MAYIPQQNYTRYGKYTRPQHITIYGTMRNVAKQKSIVKEIIDKNLRFLISFRGEYVGYIGKDSDISKYSNFEMMSRTGFTLVNVTHLGKVFYIITILDINDIDLSFYFKTFDDAREFLKACSNYKDHLVTSYDVSEYDNDGCYHTSKFKIIV